MDINIMSFERIEKAKFDVPTAVISITASEDLFPSMSSGFPKLPKENLVHLLQLVFDDIDRVSSSVDGYGIFSPHQARAILKLAERIKDKDITLICQCQAGISRSAGVAAALSYIYNGTDKWVFKNPQYKPNMLVYRTILDTYYLDTYYR